MALPTQQRPTAVAVGLWYAAANAVGALGVFFYLNYLSESADIDRNFDEGFAAATFAVYLALTIVVAGVRAIRHFDPVWQWLESGRAPSDVERAAALRLPYLFARDGLVLWIGAAVLFGGLNAVLDDQLLETARVVVGILLGGLSTTALTFLLVERRLRSVFALALTRGVPGHTRTVGIRPKLVLTWALGSGIPLLSIALSPLARADRRAVVDLAALAIGGLLIGGIMTVVAARSVADRLVAVQAGMVRVQEGETGAAVIVDEGGEVGMLQSGFNAMVAGLRERQLLQELFGRHVGDEVARRALTHEGGLGGEQRQVSALFVDQIGSTSMAAKRPAEDVVASLNALFGAVVRAVGAEGGWVNKFEGDGALAVFGAPDDQPDHAAKALRAAETMRREIMLLADRYPDLDVGIGVSSGLAVAGNVGAEERYEYTVVGDPVNEAARLTELAKTVPSRLLASSATVGAAGPEGQRWRRWGEIALRGRTAATVAYEPAAAVSAATASRAVTTSVTPMASRPGSGSST